MVIAVAICGMLEQWDPPNSRFDADLQSIPNAVGLCLSFLLVLRNLTLLIRTGQTWGKRRMNLLVVQSSGRRATGFTLFWRSLSPYVMFVPFVNLLSYFDVWFILGSSRCCLHDLVAGTIVVGGSRQL